MLSRFLRAETTVEITDEEVADACERAYDAIAFLGVVCPRYANGHVYALAKDIVTHWAEVKKYAYLAPTRSEEAADGEEANLILERDNDGNLVGS